MTMVFRESEQDGWCVETLRGVSRCGKVVDVGDEDVEREPYGIDGPVDAEHRHSTLCFDCATGAPIRGRSE